MTDLNPPISGQASKLTTTKVNDDLTLVCTVHLNAKPVFAEVCAVDRAGASRRVGKSPAGYRIDSVSAEVFDDGTVRMWLSCWPENLSGTEAAIRYLDFPGAVPPMSNIVASGAFVQAPGGAITVYNAPLDGGVSIDLAAHGIPPASCYSYQIQVVAPEAGRRAFVGSGGPAYANVQAIAQVPGIESSVCGIAAPGAHQTLVINADAGALNSCQVYILGWWI